MLSNGFKINECDKCVYVKSTNDSHVIVCLYVDDMLIMGTNKNIINSTKKMLRSKFDMKDLGLGDVILGIKVKKNHEGYVLTQTHYVESVLKRFGHYDSKPCATPFDPNCKFKKNMGDSVSQLEYYRVIESLKLY